MKFNKNTTFVLAGLIAIILIFSLLKITIHIMLPENIASEKIHALFKEYFGKAIKFDALSFSYTGNLVLKNFYLSNSTDFNDNINLVKSDEVVLDIPLFSLLMNEISIAGIKIQSPEITIIKSSGKNYKETFEDIFIVKIKEDDKAELPMDKISISFSKGTLLYKEVFKTSKTKIYLRRVNSKISYENGFFEYSIDGRIPGKSDDNKNTGYFSGKGFIDFSSMDQKNRFVLKKIDLEYFNEFITEKNLLPMNFFGLLSADISIETKDDRIETEGGVNLYSLSSMYNDAESPFKVISNENISIKFEADSSKDLNNIKLKELQIDDGYFNVSLNGEFTENIVFSLNLSTNKVNLDKLSDRLMPFKNHRYNGKVQAKGRLEYSIARRKPVDLNLNFSLMNFNLIPHRDDVNIIRISDCSSVITADMNRIAADSELKINNSDFKSEILIDIKSWNPFRSDTKAAVISKRIELYLIKKYLLRYIYKIYEDGFIDLARGYDERSFMKSPVGIFINSNNAVFSIKSDNLLISGKADLKDFSMGLNLSKGILRTENFNLQGYNGRYSANIYSVLRQDYPYLKIEGSGSGIDLTGIFRDASVPYKAGGTLGFDYTYETNAFRVAHFVQNGRGGINITLSNGGLSGTEYQKKLSAFITDNGYRDVNLNDLIISSWSAGFSQSGTDFYVRSLGMRSDKLNFQTYGTYKYPDNLFLPFNISVKTFDEKIIQVPLIITNKPLEPCIKINIRKNENTLCF